MGKQVRWTPPQEDEVISESTQPEVVKNESVWSPPAQDEVVSEPVKKKDQSEQSQETSSSGSQEPGTPSGKNTTGIQLSDEQKKILTENTKKKTPQQIQQEKAASIYQDTQLKESFGIPDKTSKDPITSFIQTIVSGLSDQLPKEYYTQRLRMSKGSFGDLYDSRSDLNAFGGDKFMEGLPGGTSIDDFKTWNNKQPFKVKQQSYDERAKLFLTEKLGAKGFEDLKSKFKVANVEQRIGFEKHIQEQNVEAGQKLGGVVQDLRDVHGANDFMSFAGNMIGQALYRAPTSLAAGPVGSIVSESAAVYDRQIDLIAEKEGISREEVIKKGLDKPAEGQALAVLAGTLDSASEFNIVGMFKKAAGKQLTENVVKQFAKGFVRGAAPEVVTEVAQGELEEFAASKGADVEYHPDGWRMATSAVGALIGGGIIGGGANVHLSPELKAMSTEDVVKNTTTNQSSDNIQSIEKAADVIDAKVQYTSEATVAQEKLNPPKDEGPASPVTMTDQLPTTQNTEADAVQERSPEEVLQREQGETGSQGSERGGMERGQQGESPAGEVTSQEETVSQDQEKIQGDNGQEQQSEVVNEPEKSNPDSPETTTDLPENKVDNEPGTRKKSILNRAYEGVTDEQVKSSIEKHGLTYEVESHTAAKKSAEEFINEVGIEKATDAVRKNEVEGGQAAFIWATAIDEVGKRIKQANNKDEIKDLTDQQTKLINEFDKKERLGGQFISALNEVYKSSDFPYNAEYAINKYKEVNHGKISSEQEKIFKDLEAKYEEVVKKLEEVENEKTIESSKESVKGIHQDFQVQKERRVKIAKARKEKIDSFFDSLKVKNDPNKLNSITQVIGEVVWNGSVEVMRKAVMAGNDVATVIQAGVDYINEHYRGNDFNEDDFRKTVQPGIEKAIANEETDIRKPEMKNGKLSIPKSLIRDLVDDGASTIEELTDQVHALIKNDLPSISIREIRDAITKYGETRTLSKEELDVKVRELKRVGILISQLEDVQNKLRPLRSGVQRDKLTDQERRMQREIKEAMKDLPVDEEAADQEWKNALDSVKSRLKNQIADLEEQIKTGEKTPKKTGIKYDQEANDLKEQRDKLKEIIEQLNGKSGYSDEQKVRSAINSVEKTIAEYERRVKDKDFEQKPKSLAQESPELKALRQKRDQIKEVYKKLEQDLGIADKKKLETVKKNLKKGIERYETRIKNKDFVSVRKKSVALDEEAIKLKIQKNQIKEEFELEQEKNRRANRPIGEKIWDHFVDVSTGVQKAFLSTADFSAVLRQGLHYTIKNLLTNPKLLAKDFYNMAKMAKSEKFFNEWLQRLKLSPEYDKMKSAGLYISQPTTQLTAKEDSFSSNIASRVPILGKSFTAFGVKVPGLDIVNKSERAYTGYLNMIRVSAFAAGADRIAATGLTQTENPEAYKQLAKLINNSTGRGNLGALEGAANYLAPIMFSARFTAARFNNLAMWVDPRTYYKTNPTVRKIALENMLILIGFNLMIMAIYKAGGGDVDDDPRSSDFGKMVQGKNHIDMWGGYQQYVVLLSRLLTGETKTGHYVKDQNQLKTIGQFARGKASPLVGTIIDFAMHEDMQHKKVDIKDPETWKNEAVKSFVPLIAQDVWDLMQDGSPSGLYWMIYSFFGGTVRNYKKPTKTAPSPWF